MLGKRREGEERREVVSIGFLRSRLLLCHCLRAGRTIVDHLSREVHLLAQGMIILDQRLRGGIQRRRLVLKQEDQAEHGPDSRKRRETGDRAGSSVSNQQRAAASEATREQRRDLPVCLLFGLDALEMLLLEVIQLISAAAWQAKHEEV